MNQLTTASATTLARLIRERTVTSRQVVDAHIDRLEQVNPTLNAVVKTRLTEARAEADAADLVTRSTKPDNLPPLHGVPCTIKECFALEGMPQTGGVVARQHIVAKTNATAVQRLLDAGAIPLGVTNLSEGCMWLESSNRLYGRTNNPYDPTRMVGGSSGGEGAIVASGASPFGLGSDIGGSIRMPAFFNGVFGHKPSAGLVPSTGQWPIAENQALRYLCSGPLTRHAEDLWPILQTLQGPDGVDSATSSIELGNPNDINLEDLSHLTVLHVPDIGIPITSELAASHRAAAHALQKRGAHVKELRLEKLSKSFDIWSHLMAAAGDTTFRAVIGNGTPIPIAKEFLKWMLRRSNHTLPALGLALLEHAPGFVPDDPRPSQELLDALRHEILDQLGEFGVMLLPTFSRPAPKHHHALLIPFHCAYTAIVNVLEMPATAVPLGLCPKTHVPLGLQVIAPHGHDHLTIATAIALEQDFGGWQPPH